MLGAIFGDIVGSVYEWKNLKTKDFPLLGQYNRITDDSVMTLAVARALTDFDKRGGTEAFKETLIDTMHALGNQYPNAGYGFQFRRWLRERSRAPYNSFGNGSAMRVSPVAWYADTLEEALAYAKASAEITHNHPEGIKGAVCTAGAVFLARKGADKAEILDFITQYYDLDFTLDELRPIYGFDATCQGSLAPAMRAFIEATGFEDTIRNAISLGGDSDTLAAIAGAVAEAYFGMTEKEERIVLTYLTPNLRKIVMDFSTMLATR